jgi:hypothetical protein
MPICDLPILRSPLHGVCVSHGYWRTWWRTTPSALGVCGPRELASTQFTHKLDFMWGIHNTRLFSWSKTLKCPMYVSLLVMITLPTTAPLCMPCLRLNRALHFLFTHLERTNGGYWETIAADFGIKLIKNSQRIPFTNLSFNLAHHPSTTMKCSLEELMQSKVSTIPPYPVAPQSSHHTLCLRNLSPKRTH